MIFQQSGLFLIVLSFLLPPSSSIFAPPEDCIAAFGGVVGWSRLEDTGGAVGAKVWVGWGEQLLAFTDTVGLTVFLGVNAQQEYPLLFDDAEYYAELGEYRVPGGEAAGYHPAAADDAPADPGIQGEQRGEDEVEEEDGDVALAWAIADRYEAAVQWEAERERYRQLRMRLQDERGLWGLFPHPVGSIGSANKSSGASAEGMHRANAAERTGTARESRTVAAGGGRGSSLIFRGGDGREEDRPVTNPWADIASDREQRRPSLGLSDGGEGIGTLSTSSADLPRTRKNDASGTQGGRGDAETREEISGQDSGEPGRPLPSFGADEAGQHVAGVPKPERNGDLLHSSQETVGGRVLRAARSLGAWFPGFLLQSLSDPLEAPHGPTVGQLSVDAPPTGTDVVSRNHSGHGFVDDATERRARPLDLRGSPRVLLHSRARRLANRVFLRAWSDGDGAQPVPRSPRDTPPPAGSGRGARGVADLLHGLVLGRVGWGDDYRGHRDSELFALPGIDAGSLRRPGSHRTCSGSHGRLTWTTSSRGYGEILRPRPGLGPSRFGRSSGGSSKEQAFCSTKRKREHSSSSSVFGRGGKRADDN